MRVFLGVLEIAGYYRSLKEGLQELGVPVTFIALDDHRFQYGGDDVPNRLVGWLKGALRRKRQSSYFLHPFWMLVQFILRISVLLWAITRFDVFVFGGGLSLVYLVELPLLYLLRRRVFFLFHGSDARPPYLSGPAILAKSGNNPENIERQTRLMRRRLAWIERWAIVISHPAYGHFHNKRFIATPFLGVPYRRESSTYSVERHSSLIRVLHSPSYPLIKGTVPIREAVEKVRSKGYAIDLVEIVGKPHEVVVAELESCDFVIDQIYSDGLMPGFATEAAAHGRAVIVGGYELLSQKEWIPQDHMPPSLICEPDTIERAIETLAASPHLREQLGEMGIQFVQTRFAPRPVAEAFLALFDQRCPQNWWFEPNSINHIYGYGVPKEHLQNFLRDYLKRFGPDGLHLNDKPNLRDRIVALTMTK